jgi:8-hydroxy-5-deazaflavin:NADPH oxidoreductase
MKIGIIGAGNIGGALTRRFTALGHKVFVVNSRGPQGAQTGVARYSAQPWDVRSSGVKSKSNEKE